jgi:Eco57I restriction-modification methylase
MSDEHVVRYKRIIAERCIYGIDINPMAVELAKLSMWLFTMDKGRPLSFLNHHLKWGNALFGARIRDLGTPPDAHKTGKGKGRSRKDTRTGNLFELRFRERVPIMVRDLLGIIGSETLTIKDVQAKKALETSIEEIKQPFKNLANIWVGLHFGEQADDYNSLLLDVEQARNRESQAANTLAAFHWELEFPELFFDEHGRAREVSGFSAIIGNPPYGLTDPSVREFLYRYVVESSDIYGQFLAHFPSLLAPDGVLTFIVSDTFRTLRTHYPLRRKLIDQTTIHTLSLMPEDVFRPSAATVVTTTITIKSRNAPKNTIRLSDNLRNVNFWIEGTPGEGRQLDLGASVEWSEVPYESYSLCPERFPFFVTRKGQEKFAESIPKLLHLAQTKQDPRVRSLFDLARPIAGLQTGNDLAYCHVIQGSQADKQFNADSAVYARIDKSEVVQSVKKTSSFRQTIESINDRADETGTDRRELLVEALTSEIQLIGGQYVGFPTKSEVRLRHYHAGPPNFYIRWDEETIRDLIFKRRGDSYVRNPEYYFDDIILTNASGGQSRAWAVSNCAPPNTYAAVVAPAKLNDFLLALLNGSLFWEILVTFMNSTLTGMASHTTPQDLRDFPIVTPEPQVLARIDSLVDEIMKEKVKDPGWDHKSTQEELNHLIELAYLEFM